MLLDAGSKIDQRDHYGQTIWKNAVERPDPKVIELLIERCNSLIPVTGEKLTAQQSGVDVTLSLPDHMLGIYSSMFSSVEHPNSIPLSWQILGVPKIDDMAISLVRVLQAGARFSSSKEGLPDGVDYTDPLSLVTILIRQCCKLPRTHSSKLTSYAPFVMLFTEDGSQRQ